MAWFFGIGGSLIALYTAAGIMCTDWFEGIVIRSMDNADW